MSSVEWVLNTLRKEIGAGVSLDEFSPEEGFRIRAFLKSFPEYSETPLVPMPHLAKELGLKLVLVKDESKRFGLNAFKVLGGAWAMARYLGDKLGISQTGLTVQVLKRGLATGQLGEVTFATATDGNHGRGVAWAAARFGCHARVYMPKGASAARVAAIRAEGAECIVTEGNYDDAVRLAAADAEKNGWIMIQDTAWEGYEEIPRWIMHGYMTLAMEALEQMQVHTTALGIPGPSHVFLQAGVGSFAGGVLGFFAAALGKHCPRPVIVEPEAAPCIFRSFQSADKAPSIVGGELNTLMAGLACGEPSTISWPLLRDYAFAGVSCPDAIAANGMRILASPGGGDVPVTSGESGAVTCGLLEYCMRNPAGAALRDALGLTQESSVLLISTEGDTDQEIYHDIVWHGKYAGDSLK